MALDDPYFMVRDEVSRAVTAAKETFTRWKQLAQTNKEDEFMWSTNELKNSLKSIEWDVEDLEETIVVVEANPAKYNTHSKEVNERKDFVRKTRTILEGIKNKMALNEKKRQYTTKVVDPDVVGENDRFIDETQRQQTMLIEKQDHHLELIGNSVGVLRSMGETIGGELEEHNVLLDDITDNVDSTHNKLNNIMGRMAKLTRMTSDRRQWVVIGVLVVILIVVLILFSVF